MRGFGRVIAGLILVLAILAGAGWLLRAPLAGVGLRWALASAGVENPSLSVAEISLSRIALKDVAAGADRRSPDVAISAVGATFDWRTLLFERRLKSAVIGKGAVVIRVAGDGAVSVAGFRSKKSGGGAGGGFPFDSLTIVDLALAVRAPEGAANGRVSGGFEPQAGGSLSVTVETALIAANDFRAENARGQGVVDFRPDGTASIAGDVSGDFASPQARARGVSLSLRGEGASWRDALAGKSGAVSGQAAIDLRSADVAADESPALKWLAGLRRPDQESIRSVALSGGLTVAFANGHLTVEAAGAAPLRATSDRGDALAISPRRGAPLYERAAGTERISASMRLSGQALSGEGALAAEREGAAGWRFEVSASLGEPAFPAVSLGATNLSAVGSLLGGVADADVVVSTLVKTARVGRLNISDTAVGSTIRVRTDLSAKELQASNLEAACVAIARANVTFEGQDSEMRFAGGELCRADGPLIIARWGDDPGADVAGRLTAREASLRFARTRFSGAPPAVDFEAAYDASRRSTEATGAFEGGRVALNNALIGSDAHGRFIFRLGPEGMSGEAFLDRVRIVQNAKTLTVAPLIAAGTARLAEDRISFDYAASSLRGEPLGAGEGVHDIRSGKGETVFRSGDLMFAPKGLQPAAVVPALKGLVGEATGGANFETRFGWGRQAEDFRSSGDFVLDGLTFVGPGRVVTQTQGVSGDMHLKSLWPVVTDGMQTIAIDRLDMDALALEAGEVAFDIPGDGKLYVERAMFPWFGGAVGVYEASASLSAGEAVAPLRAENIDITKVLEFVSVDGLEGEGVLSGVLPLKIEGGKARIENGELRSVGPGAIRYRGKASELASATGEQARIAFEILRDLRYDELVITIDGPLDGSIDFRMRFKGSGEVPVNNQRVRVPVLYRVNIDAALLELLNQAQLSRSIQLQIERGLQQSREGEPGAAAQSQ